MFALEVFGSSIASKTTNKPFFSSSFCARCPLGCLLNKRWDKTKFCWGSFILCIKTTTTTTAAEAAAPWFHVILI